MTVDFTGEKLLIDGADFLLGPSVDDLVELWGEPSRTRKAASDIRTWDELGVRSYSRPGRTTVDSLTFTMKEQERELAARSVFAGKVVLEKGTITSRTTAAELKKIGFTPNASLAKFLDLDQLTRSFLAETDPDSGELVSLSVEFGLGL